MIIPFEMKINLYYLYVYQNPILNDRTNHTSFIILF